MSAPAGTGKSTIAKHLVAGGEFVRAVTATTRRPRGREKDGTDYFFYTREDFEELIARGDFLEHAEVFGDLYGVPRAATEEMLAKGKNVLLVIDVQGGMTVKNNFPAAILIFILPPSLDELEKRIRKRKEDDTKTIVKRLQHAGKELSYKDKYDYQVVNDNIDRALQEIRAILKKHIHEGN
ncbi:guanylate kinase [Planctomycetota bacterium]